MAFNRRGFLSILTGVTAATVIVDPEKLLWVPGRKLISIAKPLPPKIIGVSWTNPLVSRTFKSKYSWVADREVAREVEFEPLYEQFSKLQNSVSDEMIRNYNFKHLALPPHANGGYVTSEHFMSNERAQQSCSPGVRYMKTRDDVAGVVHNRLEILMVPTRG